MALHGVIMAGGSGTRFWPYSRATMPKQLLKIFSDKSLIQETVERLEPLIPAENIHIATNKQLGSLIKKVLPNVNYVIEPVPRSTAACIGLSALYILEQDTDGIMFIETADHMYKDPELYIDTIRKAVIAATHDKVALIGINPSFPHTGYGYIHAGREYSADIPDSYVINAFKEKPDSKSARFFVEDGNYLWNSGMFIARCLVMLEEIKCYMPALYDGLMRIKTSAFDPTVISEVFEGLESVSIDYGVMEKSQNTVVIRSDMPWDDLGDYLALGRWFVPDARKNINLSEYEGTAVNCILLSQTRKIIINNVSNLVVADTPDATLICSKEYMGKIKRIIEKIKEADLSAYLDGYVKDYKRNIVAHESEECDIETDGLIAVVGVSGLEVMRDTKKITIEGTEDDV
ncbi:MAG: mannose-1-phosphate guanylyltransferase [Candidatus Woesearchaeota archaeon]